MAEINEVQVGQEVFTIGGSGGGVNYSTQEQDTGLKWIDGKSVYQILISGSTPSTSGNSIATISSLNISECIDISGTIHYGASVGQGYETINNKVNETWISGDGKYIYFNTTDNSMLNKPCKIKLLYTKKS